MYENFKKNLDYNKILILGFGREGISSYQFLRKIFPLKHLYIADINSGITENALLAKDKNITCIIGDDYLNNLNDFDLVIKTPGISLKDLSYTIEKKRITCQTDIFINVYRDNIIGVTGTKGKSTTTSLIYHIVKQYTENVVVAGNIGIPVFETIDLIDDNTYIILELSSHQLQYASSAPHVAVLLNIFQEHLDHYSSYEDYQKSKFNITKYQKGDDFFIFHKDDELINKWIVLNKDNRDFYPFSLEEKLTKGCYKFNNSLYWSNGKDLDNVLDLNKPLNIIGEHNLLNIMAAIAACKAVNIPLDIISEAITSFKGLEHRIEFVGTYNEIQFYNDSIATIPEACMQAIKSLKNVNTLILGGYDRGIEYKQLAEYLANSDIANLIFIADAGKRIEDELNKTTSSKKYTSYTVLTMEDAVKIAKEKTQKGQICLLSPAAASYGMYKNFEERGRHFKKLVKN